MAVDIIKRNFFIISGEPDSGKTTIIYEIFRWLFKEKKYKFSHEGGIEEAKMNGGGGSDVCDILKKSDKVVLVNAPTDNKKCIDHLFEILDKNPDVTTVITSCRTGSNPILRKKFRDGFNLSEKDDTFCSEDMNRNVYEYKLEVTMGKSNEAMQQENMKKANEIKELLTKEPFNL